MSSYAEAFGETSVGFRWLLVGNATDTCGSLRTRLLILHWISYDAGTRPFGKRDALTEASGKNRLDSHQTKGSRYCVPRTAANLKRK